MTQSIKPRFEGLGEACEQAANIFMINWPRYKSINGWSNQMAGMMKATFLNSHPDVVLKAAAHVVAVDDSDFPPSIGKILKAMKSFVGKKGVRSPELADCHLCNKGLRLIHWYERNPNFHNIPCSTQSYASCSCEAGIKKKAQNIVSFEDALDRLQDKPKVMLETIWYQEKKDETPPLWTFINPEQERINDIVGQPNRFRMGQSLRGLIERFKLTSQDINKDSIESANEGYQDDEAYIFRH